MKTFHTYYRAAIVIIVTSLAVSINSASWAQSLLNSSTIAVSRDGINHKAPSGLRVAVFPLNNYPLKFKVCLENFIKGNVLVFLKDSKGNIIHKKVVFNSPTYIGTINMSQMKLGNYTIEVTNKLETHRYQIQIGSAIVRTLQVNPGLLFQAQR